MLILGQINLNLHKVNIFQFILKILHIHILKELLHLTLM
jgi:hypothetical protein